LVRHPELIEESIGEQDLELAGIEVALPVGAKENGNYRKADIVFRSGRKFVVVAAKENNERGALGDAEYYSRRLRSYFKQHDIPYDSIRPVAALMCYTPEAEPGWKVGVPIE
jgi:hypothetical protein